MIVAVAGLWVVLELEPQEGGVRDPHRRLDGSDPLRWRPVTESSVRAAIVVGVGKDKLTDPASVSRPTFTSQRSTPQRE